VAKKKRKQNKKKKKGNPAVTEKRMRGQLDKLNLNTKLQWYSGDNKMSEVIKDFAQPYMDKCMTVSHKKKMLVIAIMVWNMSIVEENDIAKQKNRVLEEASQGDPRVAQALEQLIEVLLDRKYRYFKEDRRLILSHTFTDIDGSMQLQVAHTPVE